jgi:hypothetical protein
VYPHLDVESIWKVLQIIKVVNWLSNILSGKQLAPSHLRETGRAFSFPEGHRGPAAGGRPQVSQFTCRLSPTLTAPAFRTQIPLPSPFPTALEKNPINTRSPTPADMMAPRRPPDFVEVRCAGCGDTLEVEQGLTEFACPDCGTQQELPPEPELMPPPRPRRALPIPGRGPPPRRARTAALAHAVRRLQRAAQRAGWPPALPLPCVRR